MLDIEDFKKKLDKKSRLMGIDPGGKRIGIAISDENKIIATPYTTIIKNKYSDFVKEISQDIMVEGNTNSCEDIRVKVNKDGTRSLYDGNTTLMGAYGARSKVSTITVYLP